MPDLTKSIQNLYQDQLSQGEAEIAKNNLVGFFEILQGVEKIQSQHKINITENVTNEVIKSNANNGNTN